MTRTMPQRDCFGPTSTSTLAMTLLMAPLIAMGLFGAQSADAAIKTPDDKFVRTANYYLRAGTDITPALYPQLARYDLLIFPAEAQVYNRAMFDELRRLNPNVLILAYVPSKSWNSIWVDPLHQKLRTHITDDMWLRDPSGRAVSVWPGTTVINTVGSWQTVLPQFVKDEIMATGLWDGVFYDELSANISWVNGGNIDIHRSGARTDAHLADTAWKRATVNLLKNTRDLLGASAVIVTNGDSTGELQPHVNGRMFETYPTPWEAGGTWEGVTQNYLDLHDRVGYTPVFVVNGNTSNSGNNADYANVRYTLTTALLGQGFFSYDFGDQNHGQLWHYDEYSVHLGRPLSGPVNLLSPNARNLQRGVYRRDFTNGTVLVNSTDRAQTVDLGIEMEKLSGTQDPRVNDGSIVTSVTLSGLDGIVLTRPVERIVGGTFVNGAFARVYSGAGAQVRNGFFAYEGPFDGGTNVVVTDIDGVSGTLEKVVATNSEIRIYWADGRLKTSFKPYGENYRLGINFAVGDLEGDGKMEIVTGTGSGAGPQIRVFNMDGVLINPGFFAYDPRFRGGVNIALGDIDGNGAHEIIAGAGVGGGPHVRIFDKNGRLLNPGFFAYDPAFRGGVHVAAGDLDGDGKDEIVTGAGPGGGPHVRVFDKYGRALSLGFFAGDARSRTGVRVSSADIDGDGKDEVVTLTTDVFTLSSVGQ